jgi:hypothetical protein
MVSLADEVDELLTERFGTLEGLPRVGVTNPRVELLEDDEAGSAAVHEAGSIAFINVTQADLIGALRALVDFARPQNEQEMAAYHEAVAILFHLKDCHATQREAT